MILAAIALLAQSAPSPSGSDRGGRPWVTNDDYPVEAIRHHEEGTVFFTLQVDATGRPSGCVVTRSSGSTTLDDATCPLMMRRAHFKPKLDAQGKPLAAEWKNQFHWVMPY